MNVKKATSFILRLVISLGLISYFLITLSRQQGGIGTALGSILDYLRSTRLPFVLVSFSLIFAGLLLMSYRWMLLLKVYSRDLRLRELFTYYLMASFFNNFLPSTIGGDSLRVFKSQKIMGKTAKSVTVVIIERLTGLVALAVIVTVALLARQSVSLPSQGRGNMTFFLSAVLIFFTLLVVLSVPRIARFLLRQTGRILPAFVQRFLQDSYEAVFEYYRYPKFLLGAIMVSIAHQFNMVVYYYFILQAIGQPVAFTECMLKVPVVIFLLMVVPAVNGLGVRTAGFSGLMGLSSAAAMGIEAIDLGIRLMGGAIGGVVFLFHRGHLRAVVPREGIDRNLQSPESIKTENENPV